MNKKYKNLHQKIESLKQESFSGLQQKHTEAMDYLQKKKFFLPKLREHSGRLLAGATLAGTLLLGGGRSDKPKLLQKPIEERVKLGLASSEEVKKIISEKVSNLLPGSIGKISGSNRDKICQFLQDILGVDVCFNLEGNELNFSFGWMGYEQHLKRFPGDTLAGHDEEQVAGIAPGLGGWGYFAKSRQEMTKEEEMMEKYYVAVQTMYLPEWQTRTKELSKWYKHRKVIVVNPENGTACVAVVGDAGPAAWTGKQFGGSPEVMKRLDLHLGPRKGKVLLLFVNDPDGRVPLGPIDFNLKTGQPEKV